MNALQHRALLVEARATQTLVRVESSFDRGYSNGYVVGVGRDFVLLCVIADSILLDGFQALRLIDVSSVDVPAPRARFIERALELRQQCRPADPDVDLQDAQSLIRSAAGAFELVTIHCERTDPDVCHIGSVEALSDTELQLREINPDACWEEARLIIALPEVTRVDFGGLYEEALTLVNACERP